MLIVWSLVAQAIAQNHRALDIIFGVCVGVAITEMFPTRRLTR